MSRDRLTIADLESLPTCAVVYDHNNQVWQKLSSMRRVRGEGIRRVGFVGWFKPGSAHAYSSDDVALPAYLLDDGR